MGHDPCLAIESADEYLRQQVLCRGRARPSGQIPEHGGSMPLKEHTHRFRLAGQARENLAVGLDACLWHARRYFFRDSL